MMLPIPVIDDVKEGLSLQIGYDCLGIDRDKSFQKGHLILVTKGMSTLWIVRE